MKKQTKEKKYEEANKREGMKKKVAFFIYIIIILINFRVRIGRHPFGYMDTPLGYRDTLLQQ
jgi:hypothetical protein